jgi:5-formyltetrahydrofolate cyclo-ligase
MPLKKLLRDAARARRAELAKTIPDFAARLARQAAELDIAPNSLIGGYAALEDEADPHLLLKALASTGHEIAFPRIEAKAAPLVFHHWKPGRELQRGAFGIAEPRADWPIAHPPILLVPLLAFDARGHRLGYGGGYYDRTLEALRARGNVRAIGVAYAGQEVEFIPDENHDHRLDMVATEAGVRRFSAR